LADDNNGENRDESRRGRMWPLFVGLPLIAIIAVAAVIFAGGEESTPRNAVQGEQQPAGGEEQASGGDGEAASGDGRLGHPALGDADAPVVMVEYSDYQ